MVTKHVNFYSSLWILLSSSGSLESMGVVSFAPLLIGFLYGAYSCYDPILFLLLRNHALGRRWLRDCQRDYIKKQPTSSNFIDMKNEK